MKHLSPQDAWAWLQAKRAIAAPDNPWFVGARLETGLRDVGRARGAENTVRCDDPGLTPDLVRFPAVNATEAGNMARSAILSCLRGKNAREVGLEMDASGFTKRVHRGQTCRAHASALAWT